MLNVIERYSLGVVMDESEKPARSDQSSNVVGRALAIGASATGVLLVVALNGPEGTATAAVAAVGAIVTALVGLAASHSRRHDQQ
ncbi:hypothetical protein KBX53_04650 [Micromonospora sp. M51]|uniref:Uncharacterized protein n=1 Tax=Micromonospora parva TaxID=1464048 RepID=A0ABW6VYK8_9ACTN|nr:hypothetical protein [Micromonospora sp. M51]MBQ1010245.1 hypothetical protein [Micromonospora sp. M51]